MDDKQIPCADYPHRGLDLRPGRRRTLDVIATPYATLTPATAREVAQYLLAWADEAEAQR